MTRPAASAVSTIAIVGCGAIVEQSYLPALRHCQGVRCEALIDPDSGRARDLAARNGIGRTAASLAELTAAVDGVVVATPNEFHHSIAIAALQRGAHVLCEKPLARNAAEVDSMVEAAAAANRGLFAAMICRRYPSVRETAQHDLTTLLGDVCEIEAAYGYPLDWPVRSAAYYDRSRSGGGALLDFGAHLVDALLYVLGNPESDVVSYADDADAGVDAEAEGRVAFALRGQRVECTIRASRLRRLANSIVIRGANRTLEVPVSPIDPAVLTLGNGSWQVTGRRAGALPCFVEQLEDFGRAIRGELHDLPDGRSQKAGIALIEAMCARRTRLSFAWEA